MCIKIVIKINFNTVVQYIFVAIIIFIKLKKLNSEMNIIAKKANFARLNYIFIDLNINWVLSDSHLYNIFYDINTNINSSIQIYIYTYIYIYKILNKCKKLKVLCFQVSVVIANIHKYWCNSVIEYSDRTFSVYYKRNFGALQKLCW